VALHVTLFGSQITEIPYCSGVHFFEAINRSIVASNDRIGQLVAGLIHPHNRDFKIGCVLLNRPCHLLVSPWLVSYIFSTRRSRRGQYFFSLAHDFFSPILHAMDIKQIIEQAGGVDAVARRFGKKREYVQRLQYGHKLPASWFAALEAMTERPLPHRLFSFQGME
jgi:hypothetical protein